MTEGSGEDHVGKRMREVAGPSVEVRVVQFGSERVYIVAVPERHVQEATALAPAIQDELVHEADSVVVTVRVARGSSAPITGPVRNLHDPRVDALVQLMTERSRTSEAQPSLSYIPNNTANLAQVTGARHHLIFGRRGAGKTALLIEARRILTESGYISAWTNAQPFRDEGIERTFLYLAETLLGELAAEIARKNLNGSEFSQELLATTIRIAELIDVPSTPARVVRQVLPRLQACIKRVTASLGNRVYLFIDDFYYVPRSHQADVLDLLHACTRDADVWLKVASIRHLTRWYRPSPPVGLQTGQDVNLVDLDLSLQNPSLTIEFLTQLYSSYCSHVGISTISNITAPGAIDRLAFGSGGVPRDFLTLASAAITIARARNGRTAGITEVNQAAGDAAKSKIGELEIDLGSNAGFSTQTLKALSRIRSFCLDEKSFTYFRIDFRDKERNPDEYGILTRLLDARLIHLIDPSVSDGDRAGERSECYTLDLSQYSGYRLKQNIQVLDFKDGKLLSKRTRRQAGKDSTASPTTSTIVGGTARQVVRILRGAPQLSLSRLRDLIKVYEPIIEDLEKVLSLDRSLTIDELVIKLNRPYQDVASSLAELVEQKRAREIDADGIPAYLLKR